MKVFVLNKDNRPLMPTSPAKARKLVAAGKARCARLLPYTIKLRYQINEPELQPVVLGVDTGSKNIGVAAVANGQALIKATASADTDLPKRMEGRRGLRRGRRSRLRCRPPRWANRANSRREGRLVPTAVSKLQAHLRIIDTFKSFLPIKEIALELASFDTQKMQNPEIGGVDYQRGELAGYEVREYLLTKFGRKCVYCGKKNVPFEIEHIIPRSRGGSDRVSNLTIACHECNQRKGNKTAAEFGHPAVEKQAKQPLKDAAHIGSIKWALWNKTTANKIRFEYGYKTKFKRKYLGLDKSHSNDAIAIALEVGEVVSLDCPEYTLYKKTRGSRQLHDTQPHARPNPTRARRPTDTTGGKYRDKAGRVWRKGYFARFNGELIRVQGLDAKGNFRYSNGKRFTVNKIEFVCRSGGLSFV